MLSGHILDDVSLKKGFSFGKSIQHNGELDKKNKKNEQTLFVSQEAHTRNEGGIRRILKVFLKGYKDRPKHNKSYFF